MGGGECENAGVARHVALESRGAQGPRLSRMGFNTLACRAQTCFRVYFLPIARPTNFSFIVVIYSFFEKLTFEGEKSEST